MPRKRKRDPELPLPPGLYFRGRRFRGRVNSKSWTDFGENYEEAVRAFREARAGRKLPKVPVAVARDLFRAIRKNAASRKIPVRIVLEDVEALIARADGCCEVTGIPFSSERIEGMRMRPWHPSVDRINGKRGYTKANIRLVCCYVNLVLNEFGELAFMRVARAFLQRRRQTDVPTGSKPMYPREKLSTEKQRQLFEL